MTCHTAVHWGAEGLKNSRVCGKLGHLAAADRGTCFFAHAQHACEHPFFGRRHTSGTPHGTGHSRPVSGRICEPNAALWFTVESEQLLREGL